MAVKQEDSCKYLKCCAHVIVFSKFFKIWFIFYLVLFYNNLIREVLSCIFGQYVGSRN